MTRARRGIYVTLVAIVFTSATPTRAFNAGMRDETRVRTRNPVVARLLAQGAARSPTFAELLSRLERTHWLVFVDRGTCPHQAAVACLLHIVGRYAGEPYLRIRVSGWRLGHPHREISLIAHELQHALEVAETPDVIDTADVAALFRRIRYVHVQSGRFITYETDAARRVGDRVLDELQSGPRNSRLTER